MEELLGIIFGFLPKLRKFERKREREITLYSIPFPNDFYHASIERYHCRRPPVVR
jgi:hypothetical protein